MDDISQRLANCYTGALHDVLRMMGRDNIVLPPVSSEVGLTQDPTGSPEVPCTRPVTTEPTTVPRKNGVSSEAIAKTPP